MLRCRHCAEKMFYCQNFDTKTFFGQLIYFLASETEFEPILRRRLNLFGLDCDDSLRHLMFRNDRELYFFNHMLQQLYQLHDILQKIPQEDEKIFVSTKILTKFRTKFYKSVRKSRGPGIGVIYGGIFRDTLLARTIFICTVIFILGHFSNRSFFLKSFENFVLRQF